ncbi:HK97 family phage major capsid protein [Sphingomonas faeni]|uniref:HK97 family phage major capsid protein n=1 Tax=Sphingomonas faeni TaxID=185950 RepID=A0A2T5UCX4_9SPHN|nr:phage major capsid protein [Sphingomonas faeni]PTW49356.1 HK97 family phage major capsid protein [Sphingomonas faeni]
MSDDNMKDTLEGIQIAFNELKNTNEAKLSEFATKGSVDTLINEKIARINDELTDLQKKSQRPNLNGSEVNAAEVEHKNAWDRWARKGAGEYELEALERKAVTITGTDATGLATGGLLMPRTYEAGIYSALETLSPIRAEATSVQVSSDDYRYLNSNGTFDSGWVGETDARPETATNTLGEVRVPMGEIYANPHASQRALDDVVFDLDGYMVDQTARAFAKKENAAFINGDGVNKPQGILTTTGLTTVNSGVAAGLPTSGDAYLKMIYALPAAYRPGAKFIMASASQLSVRTMKDTTGNYIWQPSLVAGAPQTIGGFDIVEVEDMDAVAAGKLPVVFGNIKVGYLIADRIGIRTLRDPYSKKPYVGFYSTKRVGGMVKDKAAFVAMKVSA